MIVGAAVKATGWRTTAMTRALFGARQNSKKGLEIGRPERLFFYDAGRAERKLLRRTEARFKLEWDGR